MNAAFDILQQAKQAGLEITVAGDRLKLRSPRKPSVDLLAALNERKHELIGLLMDAAPAATVHSDESGFEERAALIEDGTGVPREWAEGFARLDLTNRPPKFTQDRWQSLIDDGGRFLDRWGAEAASLGWQAEDVFGVHPVVPSARYDLMGLVPLIGGGEVVAVTSDRATIRRGTGAELAYLRQAVDGAVAVWDVV